MSEREEVAPQVAVEMNDEAMEVESYFEYLGSSFSKDGGPQEGVKLRVDEGLKTFRAMKIVLKVRMDVKRELHERVSVLTVICGAKLGV